MGYTNAGKTSLFNLLTGKNKIVQNALFVTLDSNVGKFYSQKLQKEILITDTIGFISNLPAKLIQAFKSTLTESVNADILLQVIDISDKQFEQKIDVVQSIIKELKIDDKKRIFIFNKVDKTNGINREVLKKRYHKFNPHFISVKNLQGFTSLRNKIEEQF